MDSKNGDGRWDALPRTVGPDRMRHARGRGPQVESFRLCLRRHGLLDSQDPVYCRMGDPLHDTTGPANLHVINPGFRSNAKMSPPIARRHETYAGGYVVIERTAGSG